MEVNSELPGPCVLWHGGMVLLISFSIEHATPGDRAQPPVPAHTTTPALSPTDDFYFSLLHGQSSNRNQWAASTL